MKIRNKSNLLKLSLTTVSCCAIASACIVGSAHAQYTGPNYQTVPATREYENVATRACGCGGASGCGTCGGCRRIPAAVPMCPPQQPTGVTSGACKPCITGIDCAQDPNGEKRWRDSLPIDFQPLWHGEYIGPVRLPSLLEYRVRINDEITFTYIPNRQKTLEEYKLMVGDEISLDSISEGGVRQPRVSIQPDGTITVPLLKSSVPAAGKTIQMLRRDLEVAYKQYLLVPAIDILPVKVNTAVEDLKDAVNGPFAAGGRTSLTVVNPDGKVQLIGIGSVFILGMTMDEIKREVNLRFREGFVGIDVEPRLTKTASHVCYVFGEVVKPGRIEMDRPTSITQILAQAEGPKIGANMRQVVVLRRAEDWRLISTMLDLQGAHLGKRPNPSDEIWLRDGDTILVVKKPIKRTSDAIQLVLTDGLYKVVPFQGVSIQRQ